MELLIEKLAALCVFAIILVIYKRKDTIVHYIISELVYPIKNSQGIPIAGPEWKWTDGQGLDKFLSGRQLSKEGERHGRVYRIWSGFIPEIVITTPEDVKIFHSDSYLHGKSPSSNGGWLFHQQLGDCMGLINGEPWKRLRAAFHPHFIHRAITKSCSEISDAATEFVRELTDSASGGPIWIDAANSAQFPFMTTAQYIYGPMSATEKDQLWSLGQRSLGIMGTVLSGGVYRFKAYEWLKHNTYQCVREFERDWTAFNDTIYHSRKNSPLCERSDSPIVSIWEAFMESGLPKKMLIQTMSEVLFANLDVSTHVLGWLIIYIAQDPTIQDQLRAELCQNTDIAELIAKKDSLLHLCFLESLRLRPFTAFSIPESSPQPKMLGGFAVPPHTSVVVDTVAINHNVEFWGDDSLDFKPLRLKNMSPTDLRYNLFSFGFGTRKCLGQYLGEVMVKQFLIVLLLSYDMELAGSGRQKGPSSENTWVPLSDLRVALTPRRKE